MKEIKDFLTREECEGLIDLINQNKVPSTVVSQGDEFGIYDKSRTSSTSNLDHTIPLVLEVHKKISNYLGLDINLGESMQGQLYEEGQYFKPHNDFFSGNAYEKHCLTQGNRTHTLMIYLNDNFEGGGTDFSKLGITVLPKSGKAVTWKNMIDGVTQEEFLHEGMPIVSGKKYIITSWWRERSRNSPVIKQDKKIYTHKSQIPKLTEKGFEVVKVPEYMWNIIQESYSLLKDKNELEVFEGKEQFIKGDSELISYDTIPNIRNMIHNQMLPIHREFSGVDIEPSSMYGARSYLRGNSLVAHTDRVETHHVSSVVMLDKDLRCGCQNKEFGDDWPFDIQAHDGEWHKVYLQPGDMVIYESAICEHGRLEPFQGFYYRNLFLHYKLKP